MRAPLPSSTCTTVCSNDAYEDDKGRLEQTGVGTEESSSPWRFSFDGSLFAVVADLFSSPSQRQLRFAFISKAMLASS